MRSVFLLSILALAPAAAGLAQDAPAPVELKFENLTPIMGTSDWDWWQARTAHVSGVDPIWITTMSETGKTGTHDFHDIHQSVSRDSGKTWTEPAAIPSLRRTRQPDDFEVAPGDLWPTWHAKTGRVLATGKTFNFENGEKEIRLRERVAYAVMNPVEGEWGALKFLEMPKEDHAGHPITGANAGCTQRVDLPDGDVLLPVRYWRDSAKHNYTSIVARCAFDGETLTYREHGSELNIPEGRGLYEPSLTVFEGRYFLTLRANHSAFVTRGEDGINFEPIREWKFDDGEVLGSYNTQQHWVTVGGGLFLVYTRKGADNDHMMRHRAPLFIGQVDPDSLCVIRATERVLIPENHATLGNSGVCRIGENESWVTCGEGLLRLGKRKGENNRVHFVKITAGAPDKPKSEVINAGRGGNSTRDLLKRVDADVLARDPSLVVILVGTNDMINSGKLTPMDEYRENLEKLVRRVRQSGAEVLLVTPPPCIPALLFTRHDPKAYGDQPPAARLEASAAAVREIAKAEGVPVLDFHAHLDENGLVHEGADSVMRNPANSNATDGVHPTAEGYALLAKLVADAIAEHKLDATKVVCFGDSITFGGGTSAAYPAKLQLRLTSTSIP